eukprot:6175280-Pleurochrysis_carterae.AAC.2
MGVLSAGHDETTWATRCGLRGDGEGCSGGWLRSASFVRVYVRACVRASVCACVYVCACARVRACLRTRACVRASARA